MQAVDTTADTCPHNLELSDEHGHTIKIPCEIDEKTPLLHPNTSAALHKGLRHHHTLKTAHLDVDIYWEVL